MMFSICPLYREDFFKTEDTARLDGPLLDSQAACRHPGCGRYPSNHPIRRSGTSRARSPRPQGMAVVILRVG